jgi:hypothetical protein
MLRRNVFGTSGRLGLRIAMDANPIVPPEIVAGRLRLVSPRTALLLGVVALVLLAADLPLAALAHQFTFSNVGLGVPLGVPFALVGTVVAQRQPGNPIGWLLLAFSFFAALSSDAGMYAVLRYRLGHTSLPLGPLAVFLAPSWIPIIVLLPLPIALFPDGRMPSRAWRATVWAYVGWAALWLSLLAAWQADGLIFRSIRVDDSGQAIVLNHPTGIWNLLNQATFLLLILYVAISLAWVARQIGAYRRATGESRQQLKWLMGGGAVCIAGFIVAIVPGSAKGLLWQVISGGAVMAFAALPLAIGVGILKYRLYEIDRLVSRTISYALLTAMLVGVFVGIVALTTRVLPFSSPVAVAASTLAAAALFNPLRLRVQRLVDRRFNRTRYDAEAIVAAFSARLQDAVDLDTVSGDLLAAVRCVQPAHASVWIRPRSSNLRA